jgi:hypothetical protein
MLPTQAAHGREVTGYPLGEGTRGLQALQEPFFA